MNVGEITEALAQRLHHCVGQVYEWAPPGQPELPCAIIQFPEVLSFHTDLGHEITELRTEVRVLVGRGDAADSLQQLGEFVSTNTGRSVLEALERQDHDDPWLRLRVAATDIPRDDGDGIGVSFILELHA